MFGNKQLLIAVSATALLAGASAEAVPLTWNSGSAGWQDAGAWSGSTWSDGDQAFVADPKGTITLAADVNLDLLDISGANSATDFVIGNTPGNNNLNFSGTNTLTIDRVDATINTGVTGSPALIFNSRPDNSAKLTLNPGALTQTYSSTTVTKDPTLNRNAAIDLLGTSTGNSLGDITWSNGAHQLAVDHKGSGSWAIGSFTGGNSTHARFRNTGSGTLIVNGDLITSHEIDVEAGKLIANNILRVERGGGEHVRVFAGAALQVGSSGIDTVTIQNDHLTWNSDDSTAGMIFDLSASDDSSDLIDITRSGNASNEGGFKKGAGSSFIFDFTGGKAGETYTLVTFDSTTFTSASEFAATAGSIGGSFILNANSLQYAAVPEPSSLALLGLGGLLIARRRRG